MGRRSGDLRQQIVEGAADMIARRGVRGTSLRELAKHTDGPLGSTYHYFPGGKQQLIVEAVQFVRTQFEDIIGPGLKDGPIAGVAQLQTVAREIMKRSGFQGLCAVLAVAVDSADEGADSPALTAAAEVFAHWKKMFADSLQAHGVPAERATQLATLVIAAYEGSVGMCRAQRSLQPLEDVLQPLQDLIAAAIPAPGTVSENADAVPDDPQALRYPSDTTDQEWAAIEPLLPPLNTSGRPGKHSRRAIVDAIRYVRHTGCSWRQLPTGFPPWQTVYWHFTQWERDNITERILPAAGGTAPVV